MNTYFTEPKHAGQAAYQARVRERALSLWLDGYTSVTDEDGLIIGVVKPGYKWEEVPVLNEECYATDETRCSCEAFKKDKDCKHRIAVAMLQEEMDEIRTLRMY